MSALLSCVWGGGSPAGAAGAGAAAASGSSDVLTLASLTATTGVLAWANEDVGYITLTGSAGQVCAVCACGGGGGLGEWGAAHRSSPLPWSRHPVWLVR
jgi:hypothetical protein